VFFHADGTTADALDSDEAFLFLDYLWSFDDPGAGYWTTGALANTSTPQSKNVEYGPTAGHLFETPGNYSVRLTVCTSDGASCDAETQLITVADPDVVYAGNATVCVGNARPVAGAGGCPAGAKVVRSSDFDDAFANAANCDADAADAQVRCLFKRGDTFAASTQVEMYSGNGVQIGAYGTGDKPVIRSGSFDLFDDHGGWSDWTFYDLEFSTASNVAEIFDLRSHQSQATHLALIRLTIDGWNNLMNAPINGASANGAQDPSGYYFYEVERVSDNAGMSYLIFGGFRNLWLAGLTLGDPGNHDDANDIEQHFLRFQGIQRGFIGHNLINQGGGHSESLSKIHNIHKARLGSGNASTHSVQYVDNELLHGGSNGWKVTLGPQSGTSSGDGELVRRFVFERNWFHSHGYSGVHQVMTRPFMLGNTESMMIRNNIIDFSALSDGVHHSCAAIKVHDRNTSEPNPVDTYIFNNTTTHFGSERATVGISEIDGGSSNTDARANLLYVTGTANGTLWNSAGPSPNIGNREASSNPFAAGRLGMAPEGFKLASADDVAAVPGVRRDFSGAVRTSGYTRGAWNRNGAGSSQPQPPVAPVLLAPE
jgi:hypothetical protein